MKLKILLFVAVIAIIGASAVVILNQPRHVPVKPEPAQDSLPSAISNYSKTFKLNTNAPIWPTSANGRSTNN